ncbi:hypothetical protein L596_009145 [Steinernema carpocapsae]|uniref:DUF8206 domain-containing protein n=1 Tax=Steinernema carpocapsae TaxID=34508 RepID=A0A4U5PFP9_STECR|nr:hypothetical protein L596_009145 [Steinernema carpocapsae]
MTCKISHPYSMSRTDSPKHAILIQIPLPNGHETIDQEYEFDPKAPPTVQQLLISVFDPKWIIEGFSAPGEIYGYVKEYNEKYEAFVDLDKNLYEVNEARDGNKFQFWYTVNKQHSNAVLIPGAATPEGGLTVEPEVCDAFWHSVKRLQDYKKRRQRQPHATVRRTEESSDGFSLSQGRGIYRSQSHDTQPNEAPPHVCVFEPQVSHRKSPVSVDSRVDDGAINIVLLGETGVGKSTLINGIVNYLAYPTLQKAEASHNVLHLIPASFRIDKQSIFIGSEEENEKLSEVGQSTTQKPKAYELTVGEDKFRLIDVPGVGDSRGVEQDRRHFDSIVEEINKYAKIHAFCLLLPSNGSKMTVTMKYCLNELFANLHKDAAKNILFCFTKARATFYKTAEMLPIIEDMLQSLKREQGVEIELNRSRIFSFDNESFMYLCFLDNGVHIEGARSDFEKSWNVSSESAKRLFDTAKTLKPHDTSAMAALSEARRLILNMVPISAETSKKIRMNKRALEAEIQNLKFSRSRGRNVDEYLTITEYYVEIEPLRMPSTVCASKECLEMVSVAGMNHRQPLYSQVCHEGCKLDNIYPGTYPNPAIRHCRVFDNGKGNFCLSCGCSWRNHVHVKYKQIYRQRQVKNSALLEVLKRKSIHEMTMEDVIASYESQLRDLERDEEAIKKMCAKFSTFLRNNSMKIKSDVYAEYLRHAVEMAEEEMLVGGSGEKAAEYEKYLRDYENEVELLQSAASCGEVVTIEDIFELKQELAELMKRHEEIETLLNIAEGKHVQFSSATKGIGSDATTGYTGSQTNTGRPYMPRRSLPFIPSETRCVPKQNYSPRTYSYQTSHY